MKTKYDARYSTGISFEIRVGGSVMSLEQHDAFGLGLFLTGHNWAGAQGKVLYMGRMSKAVLIHSQDKSYPSFSVQDFHVESEGYDTDTVFIILGPNNKYKASIKTMSEKINEYLRACGVPRIPFPKSPDERIDDKKSNRENRHLPLKIATEDENIHMVIKGDYICYNDKNDELWFPGIFSGNKSVTRPVDVGLLFLQS